MLYNFFEIEITLKGADAERTRVAEEYDLLTHGKAGSDLVTRRLARLAARRNGDAPYAPMFSWTGCSSIP